MKSRMFASLAVRNYRVYVLGVLVSNIGTWMGRIGQDWLVLTELTDNSAQALGIVTTLQFAPVLLLAPVAGLVADRYPKRMILLVTQTLLLLTSALLAVLTATGQARLWNVLLLAAAQGALAAFDNPVRQSFVSEMVPPHLLTNAVSLNSANFNLGRMIGPAVAGLTIAAFGIAPTFALNAASFAFTIAALLLMNPAELTPAPRQRGRGGIRQGFAYIGTRPDLMLILTMVFFFGAFSTNLQITNALMATQAFGLDADGYGFLGSVAAIGSLGGALLAARRARPRMRFLVGGVAVFSVATLACALAPTVWWFAVFLVPVGLASLTVITTANATIQLSVDPSLRGRVLSVYMALFMGGTPLGALLIGWVGDMAGPRWTLILSAAVTGVVALSVTAYVLRRERRPGATASG